MQLPFLDREDTHKPARAGREPHPSVATGERKVGGCGQLFFSFIFQRNQKTDIKKVFSLIKC